MLKHIVCWFAKSLGVFLLNIPVILLGLPIVACALPFRKIHLATATPFTQYPAYGYWYLVRLPSWAVWWDNPYDGALGDTRGWWANHCAQTSGKTVDAFGSMWTWLALRNPANYFSRQVVGCDVADCVIEVLAGQEKVEADQGLPRWQFLLATNSKGKTYYRLFMEFPYPFAPQHLFMLDMGWKIKLSHNGTPKTAAPNDRYKGDVFTLSLWKGM